jgi:hypothetical protein
MVDPAHKVGKQFDPAHNVGKQFLILHIMWASTREIAPASTNYTLFCTLPSPTSLTNYFLFCTLPSPTSLTNYPFVCTLFSPTSLTNYPLFCTLPSSTSRTNYMREVNAVPRLRSAGAAVRLHVCFGACMHMRRRTCPDLMSGGIGPPQKFGHLVFQVLATMRPV